MKTTLCTLFFIVTLAASAAADTFTVNNMADPGNGTCDAIGCTLREAITAANANPGADIINFNIPGEGLHTITLNSSLPSIDDPVTIDGYSQPGAMANSLAIGDDATLLIEINGADSFGTLQLQTNDCIIRGLVINRSSGQGILIGFGNISNTLIEGCFIGTDASGTIDLGNAISGIVIDGGSDNLIGGTAPAARNLISGNGGAGILHFGTGGNLIQGNYLGTDASGTADLGNDEDGVRLTGETSGNLIGGDLPGAGNLISGNDENGVALTGEGNNNLVQGNFIGVDATGAAPLENEQNGVLIEEQTGNLIGGLVAGARNIITASPNGIRLSAGATGNLVQGNYLGTDVSGMVDLGADDLVGVRIDESPGNLIGGSVQGAGNLISGNFSNIRIEGAASIGNLIQGNLIGTDATGAAGLDFFGAGIVLVSGSGTIIGGPAGFGNVIAYNGGGGGVAVVSTSTGNSIFGNSIFGNEGIGINLVGGTEDPATGVTANDFPDTDVGANNLQNYPVIDQIAVDGEERSVEGSLTSNPNTEYVLNFYSNAEVDASGYGEGETWLGSVEVQTNAQSTAEFSFPLASDSLGRFITATATDPAGNTSEFSLASEVVPSLSRFLNISTRLRVQTGDNVLIGGFIITGDEPKQVIMRALGPSVGVPGALADPLLELHSPTAPTVINDDWRDDQEDEIIATGIPPTSNKEAAIVATLDPGSYTAVVRGSAGETGVGLIEIYDLSGATDSDVANISTRGFVETGDNVMIGGLIVGPDDAAESSILLRAIGPSLTDQGVPNALADPMMELRDAQGGLIASNDDWKSTQQADIEETGAPPTDDKESAILATLTAGSYTAIVSGVGGTTGVGLVEAYHLN